MIELRWLEYDEGQDTKVIVRKLQYRMLFYPIMIASGDIVLRACKEGNVDGAWMDVPTVTE